MDIIIRNGVIQKEEAKKLKEIKNRNGLLKKNFNDSFSKDIPGPYYDLFDSHICVPRWYYQIINFCGPQIKNRLKLNERTDFNKHVKYCCICHEMIQLNPSFSSKRKILKEEDYIKRKDDKKITLLENSLKKIKLDEKNDNEIINIFKKFNIKGINEKWYNLFTKINKVNNNKIKSDCLIEYNNIQNKILCKFYKITYKLINTPILYSVNNTETKLIWPWDLTYYQTFKLNYPDYINCPMFVHKKQNSNIIKEKYVMIN